MAIQVRNATRAVSVNLRVLPRVRYVAVGGVALPKIPFLRKKPKEEPSVFNGLQPIVSPLAARVRTSPRPRDTTTIAKVGRAVVFPPTHISLEELHSSVGPKIDKKPLEPLFDQTKDIAERAKTLSDEKKAAFLETVRIAAPTNLKEAAAPPKADTPLWKQVDQMFTRIFSLLKTLHAVVETEANDIYQRIKQRTDQLKLLTTIVQKINQVPPGQQADWSNNEEMKALFKAAKALGVEIEDGKFIFNEKELEALKENVNLVRDRMEKLTQTERADLQRYIQESAQYLQFISNLLKKMETVGETLIRNIPAH